MCSWRLELAWNPGLVAIVRLFMMQPADSSRSRASLLKHGAEVNIITEDQDTPLHQAALKPERKGLPRWETLC